MSNGRPRCEIVRLPVHVLSEGRAARESGILSCLQNLSVRILCRDGGTEGIKTTINKTFIHTRSLGIRMRNRRGMEAAETRFVTSVTRAKLSKSEEYSG
jgi:DUF4097 and DUF4098 domain-containing protein YvlB